MFIFLKRQVGSHSVCTPSDRCQPGQKWEGPGNVELLSCLGGGRSGLKMCHGAGPQADDCHPWGRAAEGFLPRGLAPVGPGESGRSQQPAPGLDPVPDPWKAPAAGRVGDVVAAPASRAPATPGHAGVPRPLRTSTSSSGESSAPSWSTRTRSSPTSSSWRCCSSGWPTASRCTSPMPGAGSTSSLWM